MLLLLAVDSLLEEESEDVVDELSEEDDELLSPASFVSRARFLVP